MLGLILYCCNLEILNNFLTRGPFSFCIGPWKLHVKYTLLLNLYIQTSCLSRPVYLTACPFHISTWMSNRYLKLSKTKTQLLNCLRQTHSSSSLHISVDNIIMFPLAQAKHLGVTFDSAASSIVMLSLAPFPATFYLVCHKFFVWCSIFCIILFHSSVQPSLIQRYISASLY